MRETVDKKQQSLGVNVILTGDPYHLHLMSTSAWGLPVFIDPRSINFQDP